MSESKADRTPGGDRMWNRFQYSRIGHDDLVEDSYFLSEEDGEDLRKRSRDSVDALAREMAPDRIIEQVPWRGPFQSIAHIPGQNRLLLSFVDARPSADRIQALDLDSHERRFGIQLQGSECLALVSESEAMVVYHATYAQGHTTVKANGMADETQSSVLDSRCFVHKGRITSMIEVGAEMWFASGWAVYSHEPGKPVRLVTGSSKGGGNGDAPYATFQGIRSLCLHRSSGAVAIVDEDDNRVRRWHDGKVSTWAGSGDYDHKDGCGDDASFRAPFLARCDAHGDLYVGEVGHIRRVTLEGAASTVSARTFFFVLTDEGKALGFDCDPARKRGENKLEYVCVLDMHAISSIVLAQWPTIHPGLAALVLSYLACD